MTTASSIGLPKCSYLTLTISMMICLILLINVSFKIIELHGMIFTASSLLSPLVAVIYLIILQACNIGQQRHVLNQCLLALYAFSIGIYLLLNLPTAGHIHDDLIDRVIFVDLPKKFFVTMLAYAVSFYLPHLFCCARRNDLLTLPKNRLLLALFGGFSFFSLNFLLLFTQPALNNFQKIYFDSLLVSGIILLALGAIHLICRNLSGIFSKMMYRVLPNYLLVPLFHYLVSFSVVILLICLACEYRLISFSASFTLGASGLLFPLAIIVSNLIGELFGYRANLRLAVVLIMTELAFDLFLMGVMMLPTPDFLNLNSSYYFTFRRIPAGMLALFVTFVGNAMLLENLKYTGLGLNRSARILIANTFASSLLCLVNYSLLYSEVYSHEQIFNLILGSWSYKIIATLVSLPLVLWLCKKELKTR